LPFVFLFDYDTNTHYTNPGIFMQKSELLAVSDLVSELEQHFAASLAPRLRDMFISFIQESFSTAAAFEKACELVVCHEAGYGRFPPFSRFLDLYREHSGSASGAYSEYKALPSSSDPTDRSYRCLCCLDQELLPPFILARHFGIENNSAPEAYRCGRCSAGNDHSPAYCKNMHRDECENAHNDELKLRAETRGDIARLKAKVHVSGFLMRPQFRSEAIAEAEAREINLSIIGVTQNADHGERGQPRGLERGDRRL
jgi:hypothetical protein